MRNRVKWIKIGILFRSRATFRSVLLAVTVNSTALATRTRRPSLSFYPYLPLLKTTTFLLVLASNANNALEATRSFDWHCTVEQRRGSERSSMVSCECGVKNNM